MMEKYFEGFSVFTGVVRYNNLFYLLATMDSLVEDEVPHTRIYEFDRGSWGGEDLDWFVISASVCYQPEERFIAIGPLGRVKVFGGGQIVDEKTIEDGIFSPKTRGPLREVRGIAGGRAYAVGTCRQVYRRDTPDNWVCIDKTAQTHHGEITDTCFESIDGFSENDMYCVGWEGEVWHFNGKNWSQIDSPTNLTLFKVRCCSDGYVYACGQMGIILRGRNEDWEIIEHEATNDNLRGMQWFQDQLYLSSSKKVYKLDGSDLLEVDFGLDPPLTAHHLSAREDVMWSIGAKDVMQFDGGRWSRILKIS